MYDLSVDRILERAGIARDLRLLDLGCGGGHLLARARADSRVGVDRSLAMIRMTSRTAPGAHGIVGDAVSLPFADRAFDVVVSRAALQHVDDVERALRECVRVLRPGGRVVIFVPVSDPLIGALRSLATRLVPERRLVSGRLLPIGDLLERVTRSGLRVAEWKPFGFLVYALSGYGTGVSIPLIPRWLWRKLLGLDGALLSLPGMRRRGINAIVVAVQA